jgi:RHS repeat-associated protein
MVLLSILLAASRTFAGGTANAIGWFAVQTNGTVASWGQNNFGAGSLNALTNIVSVTGGGMPGPGISGDNTSFYGRPGQYTLPGTAHSAAIRADGRLWTAGDNSDGQLGDGTGVNKTVLLSSLSNIVQVSPGPYDTAAVDADGRLWTFGLNGDGQLGNGNTTDQFSPVLVSGLSNVVGVASGLYHTLALRSDGTVWEFGSILTTNAPTNTFADQLTPILVPGISNIVSLTAGFDMCMALRADGEVFQWGNNPDEYSFVVPNQASLADVIAVTGGLFGQLALKTDGSVWGWGDNATGDLGLNYVFYNIPGIGTDCLPGPLLVPVPLNIGAITNAVGIGSEGASSMALMPDGTIWSWGFSDATGGLGFPLPSTPEPYSANGSFIPLLATNHTGLLLEIPNRHTLVAKADGTVWTFGYNLFGELGDGTIASRTTPEQLTQLTEATGVSAGGAHSLAVKRDGSVWSWGANALGQLGIGSATNQLNPLQVTSLSGIKQVSAGCEHSLAVGTNGNVWAWGYNAFGQVGDGTNTNHLAPFNITSLAGIASVAAGGQHSLALGTNGTVSAWGQNLFGQLGNGTRTNSSVPVPVTGLSGITAIAAGDHHSLALKGDGTVWAWGDNRYGQLGDGSGTNHSTGIQVTNLTGIAAVTAGGQFSAALGSNGLVWTWGNNACGQLGEGDTANHAVPVQVPNLTNTVAIQASGSVVLATMADGSVRVWGGNVCGQLGIGSDANQSSPVTIPGFYISQPAFASTPLNTLATNVARYVRGSGSDPTYESFVIPLDSELGVKLNDTGNNTNLFGGASPWFTQIQNATYSHLGQTSSVTNTTGTQVNTYGWVTNFNNPIVAFGSSGGGSSLLVGQPYHFGAYAGTQFESTNSAGAVFAAPLRVLVYLKSSFAAGQTNTIAPIATNYITIPRRTIMGDQTAWSQFLTNGLSVSMNANGLNTMVQLVEEPPLNPLTNFVSTLSTSTITNTNAAPLTNWNQLAVTNQAPQATNEFQTVLTLGSGPTVGAWGVHLAFTNAQNGTYEITQTAQSQDYCYVVEALGVVPSGTNVSPMVVDGTGTNEAWCRLYSLDFDDQPAWRSLFVSAPQFNGTPLPPAYLGATPAELDGLLAVMTNSVTLTNSIYTNLDNSPELRRNPTLDSFVQTMGNDPIALANYVQNQIELSDALSYNENTGQASAPTVTQDGINRGALGVYLEGQGSPIEQCALLVYLLRSAGYPAAYVFPTNNNIQMLDTRLSSLLRMQLHGAVNEDGVLYTTNSLITVNYPWVVAQIGTNFVNLFPWLKDTEMTEGYDLYDYMPSNYNTGAKWFRQYIFDDPNIFSLDSEHDTPSVLFPKFIISSLLQNYPDISIDDIGMQVVNRQRYYARWQDFPVPNVVTNQTQVVVADSLTGSAITNISPQMTNIFNTIEVQVTSVAYTNNLIDTGQLRMSDLHDREFLIFTNGTNLQLWLAPYVAGNTNQSNFGGSDGLTNIQVLSLPLTNGGQYELTVTHRRHKAINPSAAPAGSYLGVFEQLVTSQTGRFVQSNDVTALILNVGRVTSKMVDVQAQSYWLTQQLMNSTNTYTPSIQAYQGMAAYLMGMDYFRNVGKFIPADEQLHKANILSWFAEGLCKLTFTNVSGTTMTQPTLDIYLNEIAHAGNGTTHPNSGGDFLGGVDDFATILLGELGAQEHNLLDVYYTSTNAISSVQLLRWAQQQASAGTAGIIELNANNYQTLGSSPSAGYGTNLLKNYDTNLWAEITNAFNNWDAPFVRVYITPAPISNPSGYFTKMGAVVLGLSQEAFLCSGNLNDGEIDPDTDFVDPFFADLFYGFDTIQENAPTQNSLSGLFFNPADAFDINQYGSGQYSWLTAGSPNNVIFSPVPNLLGGGFFSPTLVPSPVQSVQFNNIGLLFDTTPSTTAGYFILPLNNGDQGDKSWLSQFWDSVADPVDPITGAFHIEATDLRIPGPFPLDIGRNYSSQNLSDQNNFGYGWRINYIPYINVTTNGSGSTTNILLFASEMDGSLVGYRMQATNTNVFLPTLLDNPDLDNNTTAGIGSTANMFNARLVRSTAGTNTLYTLTKPDGSVRVFQVMSFPLTWTNNIARTRPYLQTWTDNRGNTLTFSYGTNSAAADYGQLNRIQSSNGSFVAFDFNTSGYITDAFTGDGRHLIYDYDNYGDLVTVTLPDQSQINYVYNHYTFTNNNVAYFDSDHTLINELKPEGRRLVNTFDSQRRVIAQMATVGQDLNVYTNATFAYSNNFVYTNAFTNFTSGSTFITDVNQNVTRYDYTNNLITKITDPLNQTIVQNWYFTNNGSGGYQRSLSSSVDKRGLTTAYMYDTNGNVLTNTVSGTDLTGDGQTNAIYKFTYTTNNLVTTSTDPVGNQGVTAYNSAISPFLPTSVTSYASNGTAVCTNVMIYTNTFTVVTNGTLVATNSANGLLFRTVRATNSLDAATNDTFFDGRGYPTSTVAYTGTADPNITNFYFYNNRGELVQKTDAAGRSTLLAYDDMDRTTGREVFESNNIVPISAEYYYYNLNGELEWYDGPRSNPEDYVYHTYDGAGREVQKIVWRSQGNPDGSGVSAATGDDLYATTFSEFDKFGNQISVSDQLGDTVRMSYDAIGQMTGKQHYAPNSASPLTSETYGYEPGGLVSAYTNALSGVTQKFYTTTGKLKQQINPDGSTNSWTFDLSGRPVKQVLANGNYWQTTYNDAQLSVTKVFYNAWTTLSTNINQMDHRGNVIQTIDALGNLFTNLFDGLDRLKIAAGPTFTNVTPAGMLPTNYVTNFTQQLTTYIFDGSGKVLIVSNVVGETTVTTSDALGRPTQVAIYNAGGAVPVRGTSMFYSADHNSVTVTNGTGAGAIVTTTYTDTENNPVLTIGYPTNGTIEYTLQQYDILGRRVASQRLSNTGGTITTWSTNGWTYDALGRVQTETSKDGATTTYGYDALGDVTSRAMPGGLTWSATYYSDGRISTEQETGGSLSDRSMTYTYYSTGSPFIGKLDTVTDGRGTTRTNSYDAFLRLASVGSTGSSAQQQTLTTYQYDLRNLLTSVSQSFNSGTTGPATTVARSYDSYGRIVSENISVASNSFTGVSQSWDLAGRRSSINLSSGQGLGFYYQADGLMTAADGSSFGYANNGLLTGRTNSSRSYTVNQRDGEGRILQTTTSAGILTLLTENLSWLNNGQLSGYTATRGDFTDMRNYGYSTLARRVAQESFNIASSQVVTNMYSVDEGQTGGLGVLTSQTESGSGSASWAVPSSGGLDGLSRVAQAQDSVISRSSYGTAVGAGSVSATLDSKPVNVQFDGSDGGGQWRLNMDLAPGSHTLLVSAVDPSGHFFGAATNTFASATNAGDNIQNTYDGNGNVTQRVWVNTLGQTNRTQTLTWDAFDRLIGVVDRDALTNGFNWTAVYDALGRRLQTVNTVVISNTPVTTLNSSNSVNQVDSFYDPEVEFLEVGVTVNGLGSIKTYGPDADGVYGGMQGVGGLEDVYEYGHTSATSFVQDYFGNLLATIKEGTVTWNPARFSSYGPVPGYQTPALSPDVELENALGWRGKRVDETGLIWIGARMYDPVAGRFLSHDSMFDPQNEGGFSLAGGDPVNSFDPDGRFGKAIGHGIESALTTYGQAETMRIQNTTGASFQAGEQIAQTSQTIYNNAITFGSSPAEAYYEAGSYTVGSLTGYTPLYQGAANFDFTTGQPINNPLNQGLQIGFGTVGVIGTGFAGAGTVSFTSSLFTDSSTLSSVPGQVWSDYEAERLAALNAPKNTTLFQPTADQAQSAAFQVIVGQPQYTATGELVGTISDSTANGGLLEIKGGSSTLNSSYQLRLQTYNSVVNNIPLTIETTRPVNPTFMDYLQRWGVTVTKP